MEETIGPFAKRVGTTVRTLRYYDQIGLLAPKGTNKKGQKVYTRKEWEVYQQITVCKHLGMALEEIKEMLKNKELNGRERLALQKQVIKQKQAELEETLSMIERVEHLYELEELQPSELDALAFVLLDAFKREKEQIKAFKQHFSGDHDTIKALDQLNEPTFQLENDQRALHFFYEMKRAMEDGEEAKSERVKRLVKGYIRNNPEQEVMLNRALHAIDEAFYQKNYDLFNGYFPEELGLYISEALTAYLMNEKEQVHGGEST